MEITLEAIISLIGLFLGGGAGAFFTWRWQKKKAKAEAETAEVDTVKNMQEAYDKMFEQVNRYLEDATGKVEGLRSERDHYKQERDDLRQNVEKITKQLYEWKTEGEKERAELRVQISQLKSQMKAVAPLTCGVLRCKLRQPVLISPDGEVELPDPKDIEPLDKKDM